jgi:hypothetical protein
MAGERASYYIPSDGPDITFVGGAVGKPSGFTRLCSFGVPWRDDDRRVRLQTSVRPARRGHEHVVCGLPATRFVRHVSVGGHGREPCGLPSANAPIRAPRNTPVARAVAALGADCLSAHWTHVRRPVRDATFGGWAGRRNDGRTDRGNCMGGQPITANQRGLSGLSLNHRARMAVIDRPLLILTVSARPSRPRSARRRHMPSPGRF